MRRRLALPGELARLVIDEDPQVEWEPDLLGSMDGLALGGWAVDAGVANELVPRSRHRRPARMVEFGTGTSTLLLAHLARQSQVAGAGLVTFEQDEERALAMGEQLERLGLDDVVDIVVAPLTDTEIDGVRVTCYDPDAVDAALAGFPVEFIFIDGPSQLAGGSRFPTLLLAAPHVRDEAVFVMDDGWRDAELTVAERWQARSGVEVDGIVPVGKGASSAPCAPPAEAPGTEVPNPEPGA